MSKSRGNIIDPIKLLNDYGADAVRYWTGTSHLGHDTVLSVNTLQQGKRLVTKLWNAAKLAHIALYQTQLRPHSPNADIEAGIIRHPLDKWLLGHLAEVVKGATDAFENYEYAQALRLTGILLAYPLRQLSGNGEEPGDVPADVEKGGAALHALSP